MIKQVQVEVDSASWKSEYTLHCNSCSPSVIFTCILQSMWVLCASVDRYA